MKPATKRGMIWVCATAGLCFAGFAAQAAAPQHASAMHAARPPTTVAGGTVSQTKFIYDTANSTVGSSTTWTALPGMSVTVNITGTTSKFGKFVLVTFGAESACYGGEAGQPDWCKIRIVAGNKQFNPGAGETDDFAFDSTDNGSETAASWESHQVTRGAYLSPGYHTITVQGATTQFGSTAPTFWTGERTMLVQVIDPPA